MSQKALKKISGSIVFSFFQIVAVHANECDVSSVHDNDLKYSKCIPLGGEIDDSNFSQFHFVLAERKADGNRGIYLTGNTFDLNNIYSIGSNSAGFVLNKVYKTDLNILKLDNGIIFRKFPFGKLLSPNYGSNAQNFIIKDHSSGPADLKDLYPCLELPNEIKIHSRGEDQNIFVALLAKSGPIRDNIDCYPNPADAPDVPFYVMKPYTTELALASNGIILLSKKKIAFIPYKFNIPFKSNSIFISSNDAVESLLTTAKTKNLSQAQTQIIINNLITQNR